MTQHGNCQQARLDQVLASCKAHYTHHCCAILHAATVITDSSSSIANGQPCEWHMLVTR